LSKSEKKKKRKLAYFGRCYPGKGRNLSRNRGGLVNLPRKGRGGGGQRRCTAFLGKLGNGPRRRKERVRKDFREEGEKNRSRDIADQEKEGEKKGQGHYRGRGRPLDRRRARPIRTTTTKRRKDEKGWKEGKGKSPRKLNRYAGPDGKTIAVLRDSTEEAESFEILQQERAKSPGAQRKKKNRSTKG